MTVADLAYDPATHTTTCAGRRVPHVTEILAATGLTTDFETLAARGGRLADMLDRARARGTAVHADCHAYDDDDLAWETVHPASKPFLDAWVQARRELDLLPVAHGRERQVFHWHQWYTGIPDGVFLREGGVHVSRVLLDIKTGDPEDAAAHLQTAAYAAAWELAHPDQPVDARWAVWLTPHRRRPYYVIDYTARPDAHEDYGTFCAALCVYNAQPARRARIR